MGEREESQVPSVRPDPTLRDQFPFEGELTLMEGIGRLESFQVLDPVRARHR